VTRGPGPVQTWILRHLQASVEKEGASNWIAISDLTKLRLGQDDAPSRLAIDATRKAVARLQEQGLVQVSQQLRPVVRTVISPVASGQPTQITEMREVTCCRLMPSIDQQLEEAEAEVAKAEEAVAERPGWTYAETALAQAKRAVEHLRGQMEAEAVERAT